ncbi:2124_t:CDS:2, partial [Scutellospora calospora]
PDSVNSYETLNSKIHLEEHDSTYGNLNEYNYENNDKILIQLPSQNHIVDSNSVSIPIEPEEISEQQSYPQKILKRFELLNGNLVLDFPVPTKLLNNIPNNNSKEFTHMRYTACTSTPETFKENFTLRQIEYKPSRQTELFIVITVHFDETEIQLSRTLHGIMENIAYLCSLRDSPTWGKDGWKKVVVCIISDGRNNTNEQVLAYLTALGVYQNDIAKAKVDNKVVEAHIYEHTSSISIEYFTDSVQMKADDEIVPTQLLFCLTEKSKKGVYPYQWFFDAFCPILVPKICVLIDAGIKPGYGSLYNLWNTLFVNPQVAGVCGYIDFIKGGSKIKTLNPIASAQNFNYKMSYILDKPFESAFGHITSLSEGFSAYRYLALQNCTEEISTNNIITHILNFDLVTRHNDSWTLYYQKSAQAEMDMPETLPELVHQQNYFFANQSYIPSL